MSSTLQSPAARPASWIVGCVVLVLAGCSSTPNRAPVETRQPAAGVPAPPAAAAVVEAGASAAETAKPLPGAENAGKPGYYMVRPGDTLIRVALENGQNWRDLQRWNNLDNPNVLEVGQVLRVQAPAPAAVAAAGPGADGAAVARPVPAAGRVESRPLTSSGAASAASASNGAPVVAAAPATSSTAARPAPPAPPREGDDEVQWAWPAVGPVATAFDEGRSKGLAITGKAGDPVLAAADGRVVYAGSGLRGYGNLVIVKHNATFLTAYAHNQALLVKDEQVVRRGQKIAEMGASDADRVQLHFEIRRLGVPIDPQRLLPAR